MAVRSLEVGLLSYKVIGWVCGLFFVGCSIGAYVAHQYGPIAIFLIFVLMGAYMIASAGSFQLNERTVSHKNLFGHYRMAWNEVQRIEVGTQGTLILHGKDKRFTLAPPTMWSGKEKPEAFALLTRKIEELGVTPYPSNVAGYKIDKNVRVNDGVA
jgi:hypothetical protein